MTIIITGANGQVGQSLVRQLVSAAIPHIALTRAQLDISDTDAVNQCFALHNPGIVINAAAYTSVDKAEAEPDAAYRINRDGAANLAQASAAIGAALLHISTDYVFAGDNQHAHKENDPTSPQSVYGHSKLAGELAVAQGNTKHIILRTAWVFGEQGNNFVKTMLRLGRTHQRLGIVADQQGGPTYAGDIAAALITIARQYQQQGDIPWGTYHYSGAPHCSWYEFACAIFAQAESAQIYNHAIPILAPITSGEYPTPAARPANSRLNCAKIQQTFGIIPSDWRTALNSLTAYTQ